MASKKWQNLDGPDESLENLVHADTFVDKTLGIKYLFETVTNQPEKCLFITAPKGFGKSTNLKFLKTFLEIPVDEKGTRLDRFSTKNYRFFKDNKLEIVKDELFFEKNFAQHPVIYFDLHDFCITSNSDAVLSVKRLVYALLKQYAYLPRIRPYFEPQPVPPNEIDLSHLKILINDLFLFFKETIYVFFDMNESPLMRGVLDEVFVSRSDISCHDVFKSALNSLCHLLEQSLINNSCIEKIVISRNVSGKFWYSNESCKIAKYINIFECQDLSKYYGFTMEDVAYLAMKLNKNKPDCLSVYHGGYLVEGLEERIFRTAPVVTSFLSENSGFYLSEVSLPKCVKEHFQFNKIGKIIEKSFTYQVRSRYKDFYSLDDLLKLARNVNTRSYSEFSEEDCNTVLQYLTELGYFTPNFEHYHEKNIHEQARKPGRFVALSVPNLEARLALEKFLYKSKYYEDKYRITQKQLKLFLAATECLGLTLDPYIKWAKAVSDFFVHARPQQTAELVGLLYNIFRFSELFIGCYGPKNMETRCVKSNHGTIFILELNCDAQTAYDCLKKLLFVERYFFKDLIDSNFILISLHYCKLNGWTLCYLFRSFDLNDVVHVDSNKINLIPEVKSAPA